MLAANVMVFYLFLSLLYFQQTFRLVKQKIFQRIFQLIEIINQTGKFHINSGSRKHLPLTGQKPVLVDVKSRCNKLDSPRAYVSIAQLNAPQQRLTDVYLPCKISLGNIKDSPHLFYPGIDIIRHAPIIDQIRLCFNRDNLDRKAPIDSCF